MWTVKNGILTGAGNWSGHLFTRKEYGDVHIRVEARVNRGGNSGIFARAPFVRGWPHGYEAQINAAGDNVQTGGLYYRSLKKVQSGVQPLPPDEWFTLELVVRKNVVTVFVDGKKSAEFVDPNLEKPGRIALQKNDPQTVVEFRKVEIKTLAPSDE